MNDTRNIMNVLDGTQQLFEIVSWEKLTKSSFCILYLNVREQITLLNQLKHDEINLNGLTRFLVHYLSITVVLD